jgi:hypothetical protein
MLDSSGTRNGWSGSSPVVKKSGPIFVPKRFLGEYYSLLADIKDYKHIFVICR